MRIKILVLLGLWAAASLAEPGASSSANVRIVKFGIEHQRNQDSGTQGIASFHRMKYLRDPQTGLVTVKRAKDDVRRTRDTDVDGDGQTGDDEVAYHAFDLAPDNPLTPVAPFYDTSPGSQRMYGGLAVLVADCAPGDAGFSEDGMNDAEEGSGFQPRRNWTYFRENFEPFSPFRMYGVWLWQQFDFMNGGASNRVSFDESSELRHLVMRYYMGIEGMRWVVRNGDRFYISEDVYRYAGQKIGDGGGKIHTCRPAAMRWAEYNPQAPFDIAFDPAKAVFEKRNFDNVTAVGWYMAKDALSPTMIGCKWYTFEADAVVHGPERPSQNLEMVKIGDLYAGKTEVPYEVWRKVHRLARYNGFAGPRGFNFRRYGDMGSMAFPEGGSYLRHSGQEPVTQITFADALAWCNALSQQESKMPCYYTDPEFKEVYREVVRSPLYPAAAHVPPTVYVKWSANGYRLPTAAERIAVSGNPGKVWEMIWDAGDQLDLAAMDHFTVLGGSSQTSASAYGDRPFSGSPFIGFRVVRGAPKFEISNLKSQIAKWTITRDLVCAPDLKRQLAAPLAKPWLETVPVNGTPWGKYEVTYEQWRPVYDWAAAHGYEFDTQGEMGSMSYWGFGEGWEPGDHGPDEPVTGMTHYDACLWVNALSELEGRTPVYYMDKGFSKPWKKSYLFRAAHLLRGETDVVGGQNKIFVGDWPNVYVKPDANGYRLPALADYKPLLGQDSKDFSRFLKSGWFVDNSGLRTHPAGEKGTDEHGLCDLFGNVAELGEPCEKSAAKDSMGYARRIGGGFFDTPEFLISSLTYSVPTSNCRGFGYPDAGFRVILQKGGAQ